MRCCERLKLLQKAFPLLLPVTALDLEVGLIENGTAASQGASIPGRGSTPMGSHFGVGEFTTHFRTYLGGDGDVHWGYGF